jgi:hypothetical protein
VLRAAFAATLRAAALGCGCALGVEEVPALLLRPLADEMLKRQGGEVGARGRPSPALLRWRRACRQPRPHALSLQRGTASSRAAAGPSARPLLSCLPLPASRPSCSSSAASLSGCASSSPRLLPDSCVRATRSLRPVIVLAPQPQPRRTHPSRSTSPPQRDPPALPPAPDSPERTRPSRCRQPQPHSRPPHLLALHLA